MVSNLVKYYAFLTDIDQVRKFILINFRTLLIFHKIVEMKFHRHCSKNIDPSISHLLANYGLFISHVIIDLITEHTLCDTSNQWSVYIST